MTAGVAVDADPGRGVVLASCARGLLGRGDDEGARNGLVGGLTGKETHLRSAGCRSSELRWETYRLRGDDGASPVRAVRDRGVRGVVEPVDVSDEGVLRELGDLLGESLAREAIGTAGDAVGKTLRSRGDGEGGGGEDRLAEERSEEHGERNKKER